jgi:hypothetical protein
MRCRRSFAAFAVAVLLINYSGCGDNKETASNSSGGSTQVPAVATPVKKTEGTSPTSDKGGIDVSIITPDAFAAIVIHPRRIVQSPLVAEQLKNAEMGEMVKRLGVEPGDLEEVVVQFSMFESVPGHPEPVPTAIAHFTRDVDAKEVLAKLQEAESPNRKHEIKEVNVGGKTCLDPGGMVLAYAADKRTILVAPRPTMQKVLSAAESKGPLMERMKKADAAGDVIIALETGDWPDFEKIVDDAKRSAPFDVDAVKAVRGGTLTLNLAGGSILHAALDAKTAEGAEKDCCTTP